MTASPPVAPRWYRVPMVWLLVAFPLWAVIGGFTMLWLASATDDGLVVDDYYRRGQEINLELKRDRAAAARGLSARVHIDYARREARVELRRAGRSPPDPLQVQLLHATRQGYDREFVLTPGADGSYHTALLGLAPGHYHVQLAAEDWRLLGSLHLPGDERIEILSHPGAAAR